VVNDMLKKELEFRGIKLEHHDIYIRELGAKLLPSVSFPYIYEGDGWSVQINDEKELSFTGAFKVNVIPICFMAKSEEILNDLIHKYRIKTFRAGG
jgi:hypothetical protein